MLFRQMLREHLFLVLGYQVLLIANIAAAIAYWPELRENIEAIPAVMKLIPSETLRNMAFMLEEQGYWAYFGIQQLFKGGGVVAMMAASILGSLLIAREADNRTAEFLFSRPISRSRLFLTRWGAGMLFVQLPFALTTAGAWAASGLVGESLSFSMVMIAQLHLGLFVAAVFTVAATLSTFAEHQLKPALIVIGAMLLQLAIYMVKDLWDLSIYKSIDLDRVLPIETGTYPWASTISFAAITLLSLSVALWQIRRRDF
ncbi:MAG: ABC transporter permease subunit [Planctomycetes bacterium]|nr:ABC transporter permease subunit [Planctomycetota bacterium]